MRDTFEFRGKRGKKGKKGKKGKTLRPVLCKSLFRKYKNKLVISGVKTSKAPVLLYSATFHFFYKKKNKIII